MQVLGTGTLTHIRWEYMPNDDSVASFGSYNECQNI